MERTLVELGDDSADGLMILFTLWESRVCSASNQLKSYLFCEDKRSSGVLR